MARLELANLPAPNRALSLLSYIPLPARWLIPPLSGHVPRRGGFCESLIGVQQARRGGGGESNPLRQRMQNATATLAVTPVDRAVLETATSAMPLRRSTS
jgi:hypothetical protein